MVGDLPASIDLEYRYIARIEDVRPIAVQPEREDRWMLYEPDFVRRFRISRVSKSLHVGPNIGKWFFPKFPTNERAHSTIMISSSAVNSS